MANIPEILNAMRADQIPTGTSGRWSVLKRTVAQWQMDAMERLLRTGILEYTVPPDNYTALHCLTDATLHQGGELVMNDFPGELKKHLRFVLQARGDVLITGLGLGCVVRGLLAHGQVDTIDIVERSPDVIRLCGHSVADPRVVIHEMDALKDLPDGRWDFAWHDLWTDPAKRERHLSVLHARMFVRLHRRVRWQGAWKMNRWFARRFQHRGLLRGKVK